MTERQHDRSYVYIYCETLTTNFCDPNSCKSALKLNERQGPEGPIQTNRISTLLEPGDPNHATRSAALLGPMR
jgi:hypothetical protein